jgi:hypothetical protein
VVDVKRLRQLEAKNKGLKKALAQRVMDIEITKEVVRNGERARSPGTDRPQRTLIRASLGRTATRIGFNGKSSVPFHHHGYA